MDEYKTYDLPEGRKLKIFYDTNADNPRVDVEPLDKLVTWTHNHLLGGEEDSVIGRPDNALELLEAIALAVHNELDAVHTADGRVIIETTYEAMTVRAERASTTERKTDIIEAWIDKHAIYLPVYMYDHSGITISTKPFACPWDSGQVGFIFMTRETMKNCFTGVHYTDGVTSPETGVYTPGVLVPGSRILTKGRIRKAYESMEGSIKILDMYLTGNVFCYAISSEENDDEDFCGGFYGDDIEENGLLEFLCKDDAEAVRKQLHPEKQEKAT